MSEEVLSTNRGNRGIFGGANDIDDSLLFFFLILVVIFTSCDFGRGFGGSDTDDSLLFFFLLLVLIFGGEFF